MPTTQTATRLLALATLALILAACAPRQTYPPLPGPGSQQPPAPQQPGKQPPEQQQPPGSAPQQPPAPRTAAQASGPAVIALLQAAKQQSAAGKQDLAASTLERALDVDPRNPFIYYRLAELRLDEGQPDQAEALARKSNSLAGHNPYVKARNWTLIAKSRSLRGDSLGASQASSRADYYQQQIPQGQ